MSIKNPASNNEQLLSLAVMAVLQRTALQCSSDFVIDFTRAPQTEALAKQFLQQLEVALRAQLNLDAGTTTTALGAEAMPSRSGSMQADDPATVAPASSKQSEETPSTDATAETRARPIADAVEPAAVVELPSDAVIATSVQEAPMALEGVPAEPPLAADTASPSPTPAEMTEMLSRLSTPPRNYPSIRFQLPNAKEGQPFDGRPMPSPSVPVIISGVTLPPDLGLSLDEPGQRIVGTPTKSGEFVVEIEYRFPDEPEHSVRGANTPLTVIPDPRLLWQDHPSDQTVPFWKPDRDCARLQDGEARLVAASQRGRSHAHKGTCRDDDFFIGTSNGWRIAVVADGAGSAKYSRRGAQLAARTAGEFMTNALVEDTELLAVAESTDMGADATTDGLRRALYKVVGHAAHAAMKALKEEAGRGGEGELPVALSDLNTTLLIAVMRPLAGGTVVGTYTVGDGAVGILNGGTQVMLGGVPDSGEFSGGTRFLAPPYVQGDELWARTHAFVLDGVEAIVLMSDGVSDPKFKSDKALETREAWDVLMQEIAAETGFDLTAPDLSEGLETRLLDWLGFWAPGEHDDRTIAIIW